MTESLKFRVETADEGVVVTLDGTKCMVRYVKADTGLNLFHVRGDRELQSTTSTSLLAHGSSPMQKPKSWGGSAKTHRCLFPHKPRS